MSLEIQYLIFAIFLVLIQMVLQSLFGALTQGFKGVVGSRDDDVLVEGMGGRFERAYYNMLETFPIFAALVLIIELARVGEYADIASSTTAMGVQLYFWGRVIYVPAYISGIPFVRTIAFAIAITGILMLAWPLLGLVT